MRRILGVFGAALAALAVAVPGAMAADGPKTTDGQGDKPAVKCFRASFGGRILQADADSVSVRVGGSDGKKVLAVLNGETIVKQGGAVVDASALVPGKRARFFVRVCRSADQRTVTAKLIGLKAEDGAGTSTGDGGTPASSEPKPGTADCSQREVNALVVAVGDGSITLKINTDDGIKELIVTVTPDTVIRKNDQTVSLVDLKAGDYVHILVLKCSENAKALKILFLGQPEAPKPPTPETCGQGETNAMVVLVGDGTITVKTSSSEGTKEWALAVTGETVVRKNDQNVALADLAAGDYVHIVLVRCSSGTAKALKLVYLGHTS